MFEKIIHTLKSLLKKPFKVGLITYYYPVDKTKVNNGVAIHTYYLSRELAKLGCEVHVFTRGKGRIKKEYLKDGKIVIHKINTDFDYPVKEQFTKTRISYTIFDNQMINEITKENSHEKFDIIHTHGWLTTGAFISTHLNGIKWIHTFHAVERNRRKFMSNEEKEYSKVANWVESTIKYADALIAVSEKIKIEILQTYSLKEEKIIVIPNGVDNSLFNNEENIVKDKRVLYVGRLSLEKGIDLVYKIAKKVLLKNREVKFEMVASSVKNIPSLENLKKQFEKLAEEYPERFIWHKDSIGREELSKLYKKSIICIQPSRYEACSLCVLEAMACGKAVIVSDKGGMPEIVGKAGIVIPLNSKLFVRNILRLLEDYRLRERYSRRAIERAKRFTWEKVALKTLNLYEGIKKSENNKELNLKT